MDELSQKEFDRLVKLDPKALSQDNQAFLFGRRSYLTTEQKRVFKDVLDKQQNLVDQDQQLRDNENKKVKA